MVVRLKFSHKGLKTITKIEHTSANLYLKEIYWSMYQPEMFIWQAFPIEQIRYVRDIYQASLLIGDVLEPLKDAQNFDSKVRSVFERDTQILNRLIEESLDKPLLAKMDTHKE